MFLPAVCLSSSLFFPPVHAAPGPGVGGPEFRGGASHTGVYPSPKLNPTGKVKWKFKTGGRVTSSPAVDGHTVCFGSGDGCVYAVSSETGKQLWKFETVAPIASSPAIRDGLVYCGGYGGGFYAIDERTGKLAWRFKTEGEHRFTAPHIHGAQPLGEAMPDPFDCFLSSPTVVGGVVFFGSGDGNVYAVDSKKGTLKWKFKTGNVVHASPAVADGTVFVGSWDSYFYALDAATGELRWKFKTGEDPDTHNQVGIQSSAAVSNGTVYFGCRDSKFYALDAASGAKKWDFDNKGSWVVGSPAVRGGKVFFATADTSILYEFDAKTGAKVFSMPFKRWPFFSSPAIAGKRLYIGSNDGKLYTINLDTRKVAWTFTTAAATKNAPFYLKKDGTPNYAAAFPSAFYDDIVVGVHKLLEMGSIQSSPVIVGGTVYVGSSDGYLYALK